MKVKKLTVVELRKLITEAINEKDESELAEDAEAMADQEEMRTAAAEDKEEIDSLSENAQLNRWRKLAGLLHS